MKRMVDVAVRRDYIRIRTDGHSTRESRAPSWAVQHINARHSSTDRGTAMGTQTSTHPRTHTDD